uniref:Uncharacterized protein n=1 Tax=Arundo donax TaxID=35708 RepID=A0A0A9HV40_ARUDO
MIASRCVKCSIQSNLALEREISSQTKFFLVLTVKYRNIRY